MLTVAQINKHLHLRKLTALYLVFFLLFPFGLAQSSASPTPEASKIAEMSYLDILQHAEQRKVSDAQIEAAKKQLESEKDSKRGQLKTEVRSLESPDTTLQKELDDLNKRA